MAYSEGQGYKVIKWAAERATETGIMPEQVHPKTGEALSVAPLTWSHSEYIDAIMRYQGKKRELKEAR
jgi:GH15 family glucan-1,4-alpha-glucosidase